MWVVEYLELMHTPSLRSGWHVGSTYGQYSVVVVEYLSLCSGSGISGADADAYP
jgi:ABC-type nitrate/sulfonate/bicarbonate transport system permease component